MTRVASLAEHYAHCESHVREGDRDAWLSILFAPVGKRPHLHALHAFFLEVLHVRDRVREALAGELRLQWWRDAVAGEARGDVSAHPVAAALLDTVARCRLPRDGLTDYVEAHRFDLYDDPMPTLHDWESYCEATAATEIRLASTVLTERVEPGGIAAASHAGAALSVARQVTGLGLGRRTPVFLPADLLERHGVPPGAVEAGQMTKAVREALADMRGIAQLHLDALARQAGTIDPAARPAFLPASLVAPTLALGDRAGADPFAAPLVLPRWRRQWVLWRASRRDFPG